jgi:hypothetical protein
MYIAVNLKFSHFFTLNNILFSYDVIDSSLN